MRAITAWKAALVSLAVFCLLASGSLVRNARGQDDGWQRTITLGVARGIDRVSNFLSLNRPLDVVNEALGREEEEPDIEFPPVPELELPSGTTTTTVPPPTISPTRPLRVRVFGDSQAINVGNMLKNLTARDPLFEVTNDARVSTGLARPDYFNWPARSLELLDEAEADVVVVHFGANDSQALQDVAGNVVAQRGTPRWEAEYRRRVAGMMDLLREDPRRVVWVGEPVVADPELQKTTDLINRIIQEEAATRPWVSYLDTRDLLDGPNGEYVDYLVPPGGGPPVRCRRSDGVHLATDCVRIAVRGILDTVRPIFPVATTVPSTRVPATSVPPTTTVPPTTGAD